MTISDIHGNVKLYKKPQTPTPTFENTRQNGQLKQLIEQMKRLESHVATLTARTTKIDNGLQDIQLQYVQQAKQLEHNDKEMTALLNELLHETSITNRTMYEDLIQAHFLMHEQSLMNQRIPAFLHRPNESHGLGKETYLMVNENDNSSNETKRTSENNEQTEIEALKAKLKTMEQLLEKKQKPQQREEKFLNPSRAQGKRITFRDIQKAQSIQSVPTRKTRTSINMQNHSKEDIKSTESEKSTKDKGRARSKSKERYVESKREEEATNDAPHKKGYIKQTTAKINVTKQAQEKKDQTKDLNAKQQKSDPHEKPNEKRHQNPSTKPHDKQNETSVKSRPQDVGARTVSPKTHEQRKQEKPHPDQQLDETSTSLFKSFWRKIK